MFKPQNITEDQLDLLYIIEKNANVSQRLISQKTGFSVGKVNYCLQALVEIGFVKVKNFSNSNHKLNYLYNLTPKGIKEKSNITKKFIVKKKEEYDKLISYIES